MALFIKYARNKFSVVGISVAGGVFHNIGQIAAASIMVQNFKIVFYLPVLMILIYLATYPEITDANLIISIETGTSLLFKTSCVITSYSIHYTKLYDLWEMAKIKAFRKVLGDKGTVIFFYAWAVVFVGLGVWLFILGSS